MILDCESFDSALTTLSKIFQCTPEKLRYLLSRVEIGRHYEENWRDIPSFSDYLYQLVERHLGCALPLDAIYWFHTTRVLPGTTFAEGILPLNLALPRIKKMLVDAIQEKVIQKRLAAVLDSDGVGDFQYALKTGDSLHWGPYGMLVREVVFYPKAVGQHDYLRMPEIIEDICNGFEKCVGENLVPIFSEALQPAIVKFSSKPKYEASCIAAALAYVYSSIHEGRPTSNCLWCFDGEGSPVLPEDIAGVEIVELQGIQR